ncbi:nose resistant to fluoxetine protein 6 [Nilaparvata lugens]|uniref:nose resistant to fluoxetine protein 6 n=1 Tax=Nilaparvata lugens TaxID=108931 RepID=UPI00193E9FA5|nr:nose resistant to fluoxetine protein 6 [Nilaparvata lugens]
MRHTIWTLHLLGFIGLSLGQDLIPTLPITFPESNSPQCTKDSLLLEQAYQEKLYWAMKMYDASVKSPVGFISGSILQFGDFNECMTVSEPIRSQFCVVTLVLLIDPSYNQTDPYTNDYRPDDSIWEVINDRGVDTKQMRNIVHISLCVPENCNENVIKYEMNKYLATQNLSVPMIATFLPNACTHQDEYSLETLDLIFCSLCALLIALVILATLYHVKFQDTSKMDKGNFLMCFSMRNTYRTFMTPTPLMNGLDLNRITGLYLISTFTVVLGHRLGMFMVGAMVNYDLLEKIFRVPKYSMWASHVSIVVDNFFTLSGFLVGMMVPNYMEKPKPNLLLLCLNRYIRLMPVFALVTFFYATMLRFTGDGVLWNFAIKVETANCRDNWWTNLLFINNYVNTGSSCIVQAWYLPCDFHMFLLVTVIFYFTRTKPKIFQTLIVALIALSLFAHFYGTYAWNLTPYLLFFKRMWDDMRNHEYFKQFYIKTHFRATPYFVGFLAGYTFYMRKPSTMSAARTYSLMTCGLLTLCITYWSGSLFSEPENRRLGFYSAFYSTAATAMWAVGYLMIIAVVIIGADNPLQKFFSSKIFVPVGKLSYNIYIIHMYVQMHSTLTKRAPSYLTMTELVGKTIADIIYSSLIGLFLYFFVENPCRSLAKYLLFGRSRTKSNNPV